MPTKFTRLGFIAPIILSSITVCAEASAAGIQFQDVTAQSGMTNVTTSYGGAWGNLNGDAYPDLFLNNHARMNSIYLNSASNDSFTDIAWDVAYWKNGGGYEDNHGGSWADYDNDGDDDLLVSNGICCDPQFFENDNGTLTYKAVEKGFGGDVDQGGRMPVWFDYNDDAVLETAIMSFYPAPFMEQINGVFTVKPYNAFTCKDNQFAVLIDTDADGHQDLICVSKGDKFAQQAYDISTFPFSDITGTIPASVAVNDVIIGDFDNNLRNDMLLVRGSLRPSQIKLHSGNKLEGMFVNGDRSFSFKSTGKIYIDIQWDWQWYERSNINIGASGTHPPAEQFTLDPSDPNVQGIKPYVNVGHPQLYIGYDSTAQRWTVKQYTSGKWTTTYFEITGDASLSDLQTTGIGGGDGDVRGTLLSNIENQGLTDITAGTVFYPGMQCVSGVAEDFDNDMDQDIYLACRGGVENISNRLYENNGDGTFTLVPGEGGATSVTGVAVADKVGTSESVISADYNLDGLVDIVLTNGLNMWPHHRNGGPNQLFKNQSNPRNWILIDLVGTLSNRNAIGAKVIATAGEKKQMREQNGGFHRWSQDHQRIHFGLANNTTVDLEVQWPSGRTEYFTGVDSNELYRITETVGLEIVPRNAVPPPETGIECGAPDYSRATEANFFIWKDCGNTDSWNIRATAGGSPTAVQYNGRITSDTGFSNLSPYSFEGGDDLSTGPADTLNYNFIMFNVGEDGASFNVNSGASETCFYIPAGPSGMKVFLGAQRQEMKEPFDLGTLETCDGYTPPPPPPPPTNDCGAPAINTNSDGGLFVWKDCDGDNWHLRVLTASGYARFIGSISSDSPIENVVEVNIESSDIVSLGSSSQLNFDLRVANPWDDGIDFSLPCTGTSIVSLTAPGNGEIYLGASKQPAGQSVNLSSSGACAP